MIVLYKAFTPVSFVRLFFNLVVNLLIGLTLLSFSAFAESEIAESSPTAPTESNRIELSPLGLSKQKKSLYTFTAAEYFYPIKPNADRSHLPERVTFEPVEIANVQELQTRLSEQNWKLVYHCNGYALQDRKFKSPAKLADGIYHPYVVYVWNFEDNQNQATMMAFPSETHPLSVPILDQWSYPFVIEDLDQNKFKIFSQQLRFLQIRETKENVIEIDAINDIPENRICPDNSLPKGLLVPLPPKLLS